MGKKLAPYSKLIIYIVGAVLNYALAFYGPDNPWLIALVAVATGLGIYRAPNSEKKAGQSGGPPTQT